MLQATAFDADVTVSSLGGSLGVNEFGEEELTTSLTLLDLPEQTSVCHPALGLILLKAWVKVDNLPLTTLEKKYIYITSTSAAHMATLVIFQMDSLSFNWV